MFEACFEIRNWHFTQPDLLTRSMGGVSDRSVQRAWEAMLLIEQGTGKMILKFFILIFLGLLSVVSPPVFAGIILFALISITVCNLDISLVKLSRALAAHRSSRPPKIPCNFLALGLLFMVAFTMAGFAWGVNPHFADDTLEMLRMCLWLGLQFSSLLVMIGCMYKFVKLVD